jgi:DHA2 family multidrug resistance protein
VSTVAIANRGLITAGIMLAAVMGALDTTVVNVALPHMLASLSASPERITWVITAYIVATAVTMPVSGWLAARFGAKTILLLCVVGFTVASVLCGLSTSLPEIVVFRVLQGAMAAPVMPLGQAVLLNINPPERFGRAMALYTMAGVVAPVLGPVVGGYLTDSLSWRWCFYINVPAGIGAFTLLWLFLPRDAPARRRFDFLGYASLAIAVASLQLMLDRGPSKDWFYSVETWTEALLAAGGLWIYLIHTLTAEHPLFDRAIMRDRNFVATTAFGFFFTILMYASLTLLPLMMQGVLGYSVMHSGVLSMPRGVVMLLVLQVMGRIDAMVDRRLLVASGLGLIVYAFWEMTKFDLSMTGYEILHATILQGIGQGMLFVPLATLSFATLNPALRADASAFANLLRSLGGSVGIAVIQAVTAANAQSMHASLAAHIRPDDPVVRAALPPALSPDTVQGALALNAEITRQATMVAYVNDYRLLVVIGLLCLPLVFLLRQPRKTPIAVAETPIESPAH